MTFRHLTLGQQVGWFIATFKSAPRYGLNGYTGKNAPVWLTFEQKFLQPGIQHSFEQHQTKFIDTPLNNLEDPDVKEWVETLKLITNESKLR